MPQAVSLWEAFSEVPDPREAQGRRHPLPAILTLASAAMRPGLRRRQPAGVESSSLTTSSSGVSPSPSATGS